MSSNDVYVLEAEAKAAVGRAERAKLALLEIENARIRGILNGRKGGKGKGKQKGKGEK